MKKTQEQVLRNVRTLIREENMLKDVKTVVVGVSGGADSVCLLLVLQELFRRMEAKAARITEWTAEDIKNGLRKEAPKLVAVHVKHGIRGKEADKDAQFVQKLCERLGVEVIVKEYNVPKIAKERHETEEEAGRNCRYEAFAEVARTRANAVIAVGHHVEDQAETVLMNMARGAGIDGITGIKPVSGRVIRPLLRLTREEIEGYLEAQEQDFVTDSTNADDTMMRNRVRNSIMPQLTEQVNRQSIAHIADAAEALREVNDWLDECIRVSTKNLIKWDKKTGDCMISVDARKLPAPFLHKFLLEYLAKASGKRKDFYRAHVLQVERLLQGDGKRTVDLPYGLIAVRDGKFVRVYDRTRDEIQVTDLKKIWTASCMDQFQKDQLLWGGIVYVDAGPVRMKLQLKKSMDDYPDNPYTQFFDFDKIQSQLTLRNREPGDKMLIDSDGNYKKLKGVFIDKKVLKGKRDYIIVLAEGEKVLWAVGVRRSMDYYVTAATKHILEASIEFGGNDASKYV